MRVKLWHDDVRRAPEGWLWARTNDEARAILIEHDVIEASLDHDLGREGQDEFPDDEELLFGDYGEENGVDLVRWMIENNAVPPLVRIHSWNPAGSKRMADLFQDAGYGVFVAPFV